MYYNFFELLEKFIQWRSKFCPIVIWFIFYIHDLYHILLLFLFFSHKNKDQKRNYNVGKIWEKLHLASVHSVWSIPASFLLLIRDDYKTFGLRQIKLNLILLNGLLFYSEDKCPTPNLNLVRKLADKPNKQLLCRQSIEWLFTMLNYLHKKSRQSNF